MHHRNIYIHIYNILETFIHPSIHPHTLQRHLHTHIPMPQGHPHTHVPQRITHTHTIWISTHIHTTGAQQRYLHTYLRDIYTHQAQRRDVHTHRHQYYLLQREETPQHLTVHINVDTQTHTIICTLPPGFSWIETSQALTFTQICKLPKSPQASLCQKHFWNGPDLEERRAGLYPPGSTGEADGVRAGALQTLEVTE